VSTVDPTGVEHPHVGVANSIRPAVYWLDVTADSAWEFLLRPSTADTDQ
jgi:hypothetical protein